MAIMLRQTSTLNPSKQETSAKEKKRRFVNKVLRDVFVFSQYVCREKFVKITCFMHNDVLYALYLFHTAHKPFVHRRKRLTKCSIFHNEISSFLS